MVVFLPSSPLFFSFANRTTLSFFSLTLSSCSRPLTAFSTTLLPCEGVEREGEREGGRGGGGGGGGGEERRGGEGAYCAQLSGVWTTNLKQCHQMGKFQRKNIILLLLNTRSKTEKSSPVGLLLRNSKPLLALDMDILHTGVACTHSTVVGTSRQHASTAGNNTTAPPAPPHPTPLPCRLPGPREGGWDQAHIAS